MAKKTEWVGQGLDDLKVVVVLAHKELDLLARLGESIGKLARLAPKLQALGRPIGNDDRSSELFKMSQRAERFHYRVIERQSQEIGGALGRLRGARRHLQVDGRGV